MPALPPNDGVHHRFGDGTWLDSSQGRQSIQRILGLQPAVGNQMVSRMLGGDRRRHPRVTSTVQAARPDRHASPTVQRDDEPNAYERAVAEWTDQTRGLTKAQHHEFSLTLRWTSALSRLALPGQGTPQWDEMLVQCEQLTRDIGLVLGKEITSLARVTLEPALGYVSEMGDLIRGAKLPLEKVYPLVEARLKQAAGRIDDMLEPITIGGITVSNREEFEPLLAEARKNPDRRIPGTPIIVRDEASIRQKYEPLSAAAKGFLLVARGGLEATIRKAELPRPPLHEIRDETDLLLRSLENFEYHHRLNASNWKFLEMVRTALRGAKLLIIGKLAPVENVRNQILMRTFEIQRTIERTLELPLRHDPKVPNDDVPVAVPPKVPGRWDFLRKREQQITPEPMSY